MAPGGPGGGLRAGVEPFIEQLAAPTATPGGGSAAAAVAAMAAGLAGMVAGMSRGKKKYAQFDRELGEALARLEQIRSQMKAAIDADADSYRQVMDAFKGPEQGKALHDAVKHAIEVPLSVADSGAEIRGLIGRLRGMTNPKMASDLDTADALARAAIAGGVANVEINLESFSDETCQKVYRSRAHDLRERGR